MAASVSGFNQRCLIQEVPQILVLSRSSAFSLIESRSSHKFHFLKPWESQLPLERFLATSAGAVQAMLSPATGPPVTSAVLGLLPSLKIIVTTSAGLDHVDLAECRRRGIGVASSANTFSDDVADMAVGLLIDVLRKISAADRYVKQGLWLSKGDFPLASKLGEKRIGIIGMGSIGSEVAKRLDAFGCRISYNSRKMKPLISYPFYSNVLDLAVNCDALIICCALTDQTHHLIDKQVMLALGKDGVIINISRGAVINEQQMVECLLKGEIRGVGLDVFECEPNVPPELFGLDNVVLSPHSAAITSEALVAVCELVLTNFESFLLKQTFVVSLHELVSVFSSTPFLRLPFEFDCSLLCLDV